jgi:hypothetical protein
MQAPVRDTGLNEERSTGGFCPSGTTATTAKVTDPNWEGPPRLDPHSCDLARTLCTIGVPVTCPNVYPLCTSVLYIELPGVR